nr:hypothetical protein [uncultured Methanoregula sp.]
MTTICSFCNTVTRPEITPDEPVSHGVCKPCYDRILSTHGFNIRKFLNLLDTPVFLVDNDVRILAANTLAITAADKPVEQIKGKLGGKVLECMNAVLAGGCGKSPFCPDCPIRASVNETYATGKAITRRPAKVCRKNRTTHETVSFLVSTRKAGDVVLLRLEPGEAE